MIDVEVGAAQLSGSLTLYPLFPLAAAPDDYLTGAELGPGVLEIDESGGGNVPELLVTNLAPKPLLLLEGETITGNRQDRVLNVSVLLGTGGPRPIPVSCVEAGRWGAKAAARRSERHVPLALKRQLAEDVHRSKRARGERHSDQGAVWAQVDRLASVFGASAPTRSYHDVERVARGRTVDVVREVRPLPEQVGVVVAIGGTVTALELFDSPRGLGAHWDALVHGYAVDAVGAAEVTPSDETVHGFLGRVTTTDVDVTPAVDLGEELSATTDELVLSGLRWNGRIVHLAAFARVRSGAGLG